MKKESSNGSSNENGNTDNALFVSVSKVVVRYQETDQMGIAHHSVYPIWFEVGRSEFINKYCASYGKLEADGLYLPLIGLSCVYKSSARYEDKLYIKTRVSAFTRTRIVFAYEVFKGSTQGARLAYGETTHVFSNRGLKPVNLSRYRPDVYSLFAGIFSESELK